MASACASSAIGPAFVPRITSSTGRVDRPVTTISSTPVHVSFVPNLPLPADHIADGSPAFDTLSGL